MNMSLPKALPPKGHLSARPMSSLAKEERARIAAEVLDRYMDGQQVANMAADYGVGEVTIYALLLREHTDSWREVQTARALARLERHQDGLEGASDQLSLARAREGVRSAQWELERLLRRLYGPEDKDHNPEITIVINKLGEGPEEVTVSTQGRVTRTIEG